MTETPEFRLAVFASGGATAATALWARALKGTPEPLVGLITDRPEIPALAKASRCQVPFFCLPWEKKRRLEWCRRAHAQLQEWGATDILLAGFLRILPAEFVESWGDHIFNLHPSLLPRHAGLMDLAVHTSVLDAGDLETGCTLHKVIAQVDAGPIVAQKRCGVAPGDSPETLRAKVQALEIQLVHEWVAGRLSRDVSRSDCSAGSS